ncbi:MAG: cytochrome C oxidase subunit IV family protein [Planctomycetota bacterium]|nr:cytochrome C oxidase subunit IV family protein [Planctomycetota bacterium]
MTHTPATTHGDSHAAGAHHALPNYIAIFGILILLTLASVVADSVGGTIGKVMVGLIVLVIASLKAMCVMMYFMHLKFEGAWKYALLAPTIILALAVPAALAPDIAFKYYDLQVPQQKAKVEQDAEHAAGVKHPGEGEEVKHPETAKPAH